MSRQKKDLLTEAEKSLRAVLSPKTGGAPQAVRPLPLEDFDDDKTPEAVEERKPDDDEPIELRVVLGRVRLTSDDADALRSGSVVSLGQHADEPVEVYAGSRLVARGEAVVVDGKVGVRVTELATRQTPRRPHQHKRTCGQ